MKLLRHTAAHAEASSEVFWQWALRQPFAGGLRACAPRAAREVQEAKKQGEIEAQLWYNANMVVTPLNLKA